MALMLPVEIAKLYSSNSQRVRIMTEYWVGNTIFCPNCGSNLTNFRNNSPVADFYCEKCSEEYELKSKNGNMGNTIVDGAYFTMIERLVSDNNPNFFFLTYNKSTLEIRNFLTEIFLCSQYYSEKKSLEPKRKKGWLDWL